MPKDDWLKLAILYDEHANYSPSNTEAIDRFWSSATYNQIYPTILGADNLDLLPEFDGLFIRDTTYVNHYTQDFAVYAQSLGMPVLDTPAAIFLGGCKMLQFANFKQRGIPHPKTRVIHTGNVEELPEALSYPQVVKIPDSCFSRGVYMAHDKTEFVHITGELMALGNPKLITQDFLKTAYDWRLCVFQKEILFACKYYMAEDDWKIVKYDRQGAIVEGNHECIPLYTIPPEIKSIVEQTYAFLDHSLYGIDIKEYAPNKYAVIEINDNPNIDAGVEDELLGMEVYDRIIDYFKTEMRQRCPT